MESAGWIFSIGLGAAERANLVKQCLTKLHYADVTLISLTCDGAASNIAMFDNLGCSFKSDIVESVFKHPVTEKKTSVCSSRSLSC